MYFVEIQPRKTKCKAVGKCIEVKRVLHVLLINGNGLFVTKFVDTLHVSVQDQVEGLMQQSADEAG